MASTSVRRAVVRPYNPSSDFDDVVKIVIPHHASSIVRWSRFRGYHRANRIQCKATAHPSINSVADILPYIYAIPYVNLEPETAFVLDTGSPEPGCPGDEGGRVVGYIIGTANTQEFVERYRTEHLISTDLPNAASAENPSEENELRNSFLRILHEPEGMLHAKHPEFLEQYPAHLHIDILSSHQRKGYGGILISEFLNKLRKKEVKGVHLGMRADNTLAGNFYEKHGFERFADIEMDGTTWMTRVLKSDIN